MKLTTPVLLCALALLGRAPALFGFDVHAYVAALQADAPVPLAIHIHEEETLYALYVREPGASECNWVEYVDKSGQRLNHTGGLKPFSGGFDLAAYIGQVSGSVAPNPMTAATVNGTWRWEGGAYSVTFVETSDYGSTTLYSERISYHGDVLSSEHFASPSESSGSIGVWEDSYSEPSTEEWLMEFNGTLAWLDAWGEANWEDEVTRQWLAASAIPDESVLSEFVMDAALEAAESYLLASRSPTRGGAPRASVAEIELAMMRRISSERDPARREQMQRELARFRDANGLRPPNTSGGPNAEIRGTAPTLVTNPKHHPNSVSPQPPNVADLYARSIPDHTGVRWSIDQHGVIHRFARPSNNQTHWNGSTAGRDPIQLRNIPAGILQQLKPRN